MLIYLLCIRKKDRHGKLNYRPASILPLSSKLFEHTLYEQEDNHTKDIFSNIREDFEKHSAPDIHY